MRYFRMKFPVILFVVFGMVMFFAGACKPNEEVASNGSFNEHYSQLNYQAIMIDSAHSKLYLANNYYKLINGDTAADLSNKIKQNIKFDLLINGVKVRDGVKYLQDGKETLVYDSMGFSCKLNTYDFATNVPNTADIPVVQFGYPTPGGDSMVVIFYIDVLDKNDFTKGDRYISSIRFKTPKMPVDECLISCKSDLLPLHSTFQFYSNSTPTPVAFSWTFGDGGKSFAANPEYIYQSTGKYTVVLAATFADRKVLCDSMEIEVIDKPDSVFITKIEMVDVRYNKIFDSQTASQLPDLVFRFWNLNALNEYTNTIKDAKAGMDTLEFNISSPIFWFTEPNKFTSFNVGLLNENINTDGDTQNELINYIDIKPRILDFGKGKVRCSTVDNNTDLSSEFWIYYSWK